MFELTVTEMNGEPRMRDLDIAEALGFSRLRDIRKLISRHIEALSEFGEIICATWRISQKQRGRVPDEQWLNEKQALFIAAKCETPTATQVLLQMVDVFAAWRNGRLSAPAGDPKPKYEDMPATECQAYLTMVREARLLRGKAAAWALWQSLPLPEIPLVDLDADLGRGARAGDAILMFFKEECVLTGDPNDFTRGRALWEAYRVYCDLYGVAPVGSRSFANAFRLLSRTYVCPETGRRFRPMKRSDTGYCGIRLR